MNNLTEGEYVLQENIDSTDDNPGCVDNIRTGTGGSQQGRPGQDHQHTERSGTTGTLATGHLVMGQGVGIQQVRDGCYRQSDMRQHQTRRGILCDNLLAPVRSRPDNEG
jgi:hypothetical protein